MNAFEKFIRYLSDFHPLSSELVEYLAASIKTEQHQKNHVLISQGRLPGKIWFLENGGARVYRHDQKTGEELTIWFWKNELVLPLDGLQGTLPSATNISLLDQTTVLTLEQVHLKYLPQLFPEYQKISQGILESLCRNLSEHLDLLQHADSALRYELTMEHNHQLFAQGNLRDIASYLGMSISTIKHLRYGQ